MALMLGSKAVNVLVSLLNKQKIEKHDANDNVLKMRYIRTYPYEKDKSEDGEYICVNFLPFTHNRSKEIEDGTININVHVPTNKDGGIPQKRLADICDIIIALFVDELYIGGAYYSFYCDSRPMEDNDNTYFVNLQIIVTYNNLHTEELKSNNN